MGKASLIYDRPEIAPLMNKIVTKDEPIWIGPFAFDEMFYAQSRPASKYHIFIPGMASSPEIKTSFIEEFERTKPPVIYFQSNFFILGRSPDTYGQFFLDYLKENYVRLMDYEKNGVRYDSLVPISERVDLNARLFIRKDKTDEILKRLLEQKMVQPITEHKASEE